MRYRQKIYTPFDKMSQAETIGLANFLFEHMEKQEDSLGKIKRKIQEAMQEIPMPGGFVIISQDRRRTNGAIVVRHDGESDTIQYVAVHRKYRRQGIARELFENAIRHAQGDLVLHSGCQSVEAVLEHVQHCPRGAAANNR